MRRYKFGFDSGRQKLRQWACEVVVYVGPQKQTLMRKHVAFLFSGLLIHEKLSSLKNLERI